MRKTIRTFSMCVAVIAALHACQSKKEPSEAVKEFVKRLDGKSLTEAKEILSVENSRVSSFISMMKGMKEDKPEHFKPEDEREGTPFKLPDVVSQEAAYQSILADVGFNQHFSVNYSILEPDGPSLRKLSAETPKFIAKEVYFHDGTKQSEKLDLSDDHRINSLKTVDSALVDVSYSYPEKFATVELDNSNKKKEFKGETIKLERIEDNSVRIYLEKAAFTAFLEIEAFNKDGKLLQRSSYSQSPEGGADIMTVLNQYKKVIEKLQGKLEKGAYKDIAALQQDVVKEMPDLTPFDQPEKGYLEAFFRGNVAKVKLYLKDGVKEASKTFVIKNLAPNYTGLVLVQDPATEKYGFLSAATGKVVIPYQYDGMRQITPYFFMAGSMASFHNYRLDTATQKLVELNDVVDALTPELVTVVAKEDEQNHNRYGVMKGSGELLFPREFDRVSFDPQTKLIFGNKWTEDGPLAGFTTLYDQNGKFVTGPYKTNDVFTDGLLLVVEKSGNSLFIDPKGTKVIDLKGYFNIEPFSEGLSSMQNKEFKYGFLDKQGKIAIPFEFTSVTNFNEGISMVTRRNNDVEEAALIDKSGAQVVPFRPSSEQDTDGQGMARVYTLQGKKFDVKGREKK